MMRFAMNKSVVERAALACIDDTVWLTQRRMAELFETTPEDVVMRLKKICADGDFEEPATAKDSLAVRMEGKRKVQRQLKRHQTSAQYLPRGQVETAKECAKFAHTRAESDEAGMITAGPIDLTE